MLACSSGLLPHSYKMIAAAPDITITFQVEKREKGMTPTVWIPSYQTGKALLGNPHRPQEAEVTLQPLSSRNHYFACLGSLMD